MDNNVRLNYHKDSETAVNRMINMELYGSYVYLSMSYYFDRGDVALDNFAKFFKKQSYKEREQVEKLMNFQNQRGGQIMLQDIKKPEQDDWDDGLQAMQCALQLEKNINQSLLELHKLSKDRIDPHLCDFLETQFFEKQVKTIKKLGDHITNLQRLGAPQNGMAEYMFNKYTLGMEQAGQRQDFSSDLMYNNISQQKFSSPLNKY